MIGESTRLYAQFFKLSILTGLYPPLALRVGLPDVLLELGLLLL